MGKERETPPMSEPPHCVQQRQFTYDKKHDEAFESLKSSINYLNGELVKGLYEELDRYPTMEVTLKLIESGDLKLLCAVDNDDDVYVLRIELEKNKKV